MHPTLAHVNFCCLPPLPQRLQMRYVGVESRHKIRQNLVIHIELPTHVLDDGRDGWVVVLTHSGEQMVSDLVVQGAAEEGGYWVVVRIVHTALYLGDRPFVHDVAILS